MAGDGTHLPSSLRGFAENPNPNLEHEQPPPPKKKKRNLPGNPDPDAEVIALSPRTLMATNRFVCEICNKGFQRDQNLQLHRRGHNLPWKLRQRTSKEIRKRVYICPEKTCVHNDPSRALGDLTGIKKHFSRKHGEKKWKCEKCSKRYAVQSDWKAHSKTCGTREYKCDCGTLFSRKDSFITHRAFCDALAEESARLSSVAASAATTGLTFRNDCNNNAMNTSHLSSSPSTSSMPHGFGAFRPNFAPNSEPTGHPKPRLSLWLDQGSGPNSIDLMRSHLNSIEGASNPQTFFSEVTKSIPNSSNSSEFCPSSQAENKACPPELLHMVPGNMFGSSSPLDFMGFPSDWLDRGSNTGASLSLSTSSSLKDDNGGKTHLGGLASLYSTPQNHSSHGAHMSATALLQKAAQIGATTSNPSMLRGLGVSSCDVQTVNEFQLFGFHEKEPENFNDLMNSLSTPSGNGLFNGVNLGSLPDSGNEFQGLIIPTSTDKRSQNVHFYSGDQTKVQHEGEQGLTRDFLGVGDNGGPFSQHEMAKFASMRSAMDLSSYNSTH
ncbi:protein indeterminate-domain 9 [Amborella trichopoda]|uniref:C2H2-type domain-containing protein n=1 Tax=Amborella trichopoda TaxID=13333 RepID=W1PC96_AMBTC|nr:protein indeterminate-domain 9 [Amborella trichopoda]ERN05221.1 hypothetical protein AMTR_s00007p00061550 [Amborella trichopoda]|eukprot:XP_006843546.1 protein indeterminate-domain 9 [Amborella trichopoda]